MFLSTIWSNGRRNHVFVFLTSETKSFKIVTIVLLKKIKARFLNERSRYTFSEYESKFPCGFNVLKVVE